MTPSCLQNNNAEFLVEENLRSIVDVPVLTPLGVTIKAQADKACVSLGKEGSFQAGIHLGPSIA